VQEGVAYEYCNKAVKERHYLLVELYRDKRGGRDQREGCEKQVKPFTLQLKKKKNSRLSKLEWKKRRFCWMPPPRGRKSLFKGAS